MTRPYHSKVAASILTIAAIAALACRDQSRTTEPKAASQTAQTSQTSQRSIASPLRGVVADTTPLTLCQSYERIRARYAAALASNPKDASLQQKVATFKTLVADACSD